MKQIFELVTALRRQILNEKVHRKIFRYQFSYMLSLSLSRARAFAFLSDDRCAHTQTSRIAARLNDCRALVRVHEIPLTKIHRSGYHTYICMYMSVVAVIK